MISGTDIIAKSFPLQQKNFLKTQMTGHRIKIDKQKRMNKLTNYV